VLIDPDKNPDVLVGPPKTPEVLIDPRKDPDLIKDNVTGLPPSGEPTGEPVRDTDWEVPVFGAGQIVFSSFGRVGGTENGIYIMESNGAARKVVVKPDVPFRSPALSPDGQHIAYAAGGSSGETHTHIRHLETGNEFRLTERDGLHPAWSPDGRHIAFAEKNNLYISSVDLNPRVLQLTHDGVFNTTPSWSPDGRHIAFASMLDGNYNLFLISIEGGGRVRLTNNPADDEEPDFSPDGTQIAFMSHRDGTWNIYIVDIRTFQETQITVGGDYREPSWSPDGKKLAIEEALNGEIYTINADGTGLTNITNSPDYETSPDWR
jgi:Tol biopolymer transport system component